MLFSEVMGYLTKIPLPDVQKFPLSYWSGRLLNQKLSTIFGCQKKLYGRNPLLKTIYFSDKVSKNKGRKDLENFSLMDSNHSAIKCYLDYLERKYIHDNNQHRTLQPKILFCWKGYIHCYHGDMSIMRVNNHFLII